MENKIGGNTGNRGKGRPKGSPNKTTALLKDAILAAAEKAGDEAGMIGYLEKQAKDNPTAFLSLLGRVLPLQLASDPDEPLKTVIEWRVIGGELP